MYCFYVSSRTVWEIETFVDDLKWAFPLRVLNCSFLNPFLRSVYLTGNQSSAFPVTVPISSWTAWNGTRSMRFMWWQRMSRANLSPVSSPSRQIQSPQLSQVLFPSYLPRASTHTSHSAHRLLPWPENLLFGSLTFARCLFKACWLQGRSWIIYLCLSHGRGVLFLLFSYLVTKRRCTMQTPLMRKAKTLL